MRISEPFSKHCKKFVILAFLKSSGRGPARHCTSHPEPFHPKTFKPKILNYTVSPKTEETMKLDDGWPESEKMFFKQL